MPRIQKRDKEGNLILDKDGKVQWVEDDEDGNKKSAKRR